MQDVVFMVVLVAFFGLAALFVVACDRIIGRDDEALAEGARGAQEPGPEAERWRRDVGGVRPFDERR